MRLATTRETGLPNVLLFAAAGFMEYTIPPYASCISCFACFILWLFYFYDVQNVGGLVDVLPHRAWSLPGNLLGFLRRLE